METYAIWQEHNVIGYIDLMPEQREKLNNIRDLGVYFGYDHKLRPDIYHNGKDQCKEKNS